MATTLTVEVVTCSGAGVPIERSSQPTTMPPRKAGLSGSDPTPALFAHLPEGLFGPLASPNRLHYWSILGRLYAEYFGPDAPLLALALEDRPELREYFARLRDVRLEITGADLIALGLDESPRVGHVLAEVRRRKLNGELDGRDEELAAARKLVEEGVPA